MFVRAGSVRDASYYFNDADKLSIAAMNMLRMGQVKRFDGDDAVGRAKFGGSLSGLAA